MFMELEYHLGGYGTQRGLGLDPVRQVFIRLSPTVRDRDSDARAFDRSAFGV